MKMLKWASWFLTPIRLPSMESAAEKAGVFSYQPITNLPPKRYSKVQIITAHEVIEDARVDCPPTMRHVKRYRKLK